MQMITSKWVSQAIFAIAKLGVADHLAHGPKTAEQIAPEINAHAPSLYRVMRTVASLGVFAEVADRKFQLTPLGHLLRSDVPGSLRWNAMFLGTKSTWEPWGEIVYSVQTGKPAFDRVYGEPIFEYYRHQKDEAEIFNKAMTGFSDAIGEAVVEAYDFRDAGVIADIAGGHGQLLRHVLDDTPGARGILFDLPEVIAGAPVDQRIQAISGSFFESIPSGASTYVLSHIIHDWDDESSIRILSNIRKVIPADGRVLLVESVVGVNGHPFAPLLDMEMLVLVTGKERTEEEYRALLQASGFQLNAILPTQSVVQVLEARPQ